MNQPVKEDSDTEEDKHRSEFSTCVKRPESFAIAAQGAQGNAEVPTQREGPSSHKRFLKGNQCKPKAHGVRSPTIACRRMDVSLTANTCDVR